MLTARKICITSAVLGALGVMLGAFGAHYISESVTASQMATFKTGTSYMQLHAVVMLIVGVSALKWDERRLLWSGTGFAVGILLFSGSLVVLALTGISWLGALAPVGGLFLIGSWILAALGFARVSEDTH